MITIYMILNSIPVSVFEHKFVIIYNKLRNSCTFCKSVLASVFLVVQNELS